MSYDRIPTDTDIVIPIYNSLNCVRDCLDALEGSTAVPYRLYLIDDASDSTTSAFLQRRAENSPHIILHRNPENLGFVRSANLGMQMGRSPYVVLLNSDVIVTPEWLERLLECAESDPKIASVNPFTNYASNINIPIAPGANFFGMDLVLKNHARRDYPDVVTGVGFCLLLRRSALEEVGYFDEIFDRGYCEDSDLCMRLVASGYRTVVADNVYVYHKGRGSFADRDERYLRNRKIFDARWAKEYKRQFAAFRATDPLRPARELFRVLSEWDPIPSMRETYRRIRNCWREGHLVKAGKEAVKGAIRLPEARRDFVTPEVVERFSRPDRLRVTYVIHALTVAGGVLSVVQLVNELILLGVEARIATLREYPEIYDWGLLTRPMLFKTWDELVGNLPETEIAVATHWTSAQPVRRIIERGTAKIGVYFVQDYEPWFFAPEDQDSRNRVRKTYSDFPNRIVKSDWLKALLEKEEGVSSTKIRLGMDLGIFYPRPVPRKARPVILAMARPRTPRRGFHQLVEAISRIRAVRPEVEVVFFGDDLSHETVPFPYRDEGVITNRNRLAQLYSEADIFIDASDFQGFGRTALEAMACGTPCVVTGVGGVTEYARHEQNCLVVPPRSPDAIAEATLRILNDEDLRKRLLNEGLETVKDYSHKREARKTLDYFSKLLQGGEPSGTNRRCADFEETVSVGSQPYRR